MSSSPSRGQIAQINLSDGGAPKRPQPSARITVEGLEGDRQRHTEYHGGPDRAVCLYSLERILALQREGHPIYAGSTGENVTVAGIDWDQVVPGRQLRLGAEVVVEVTKFATPCPTIAGSFRDGVFDRILQREHPGWARVCARVLEAGSIRVGDPVDLMGR